VKATVFLGGGRITSALIAGLHLANYQNPIIVHDRHPEKLRRLKREFQVATESDLHEAARSAGILVIAVRPGSVRDLLLEIGEVRNPLIAVSLAAGIPLVNLTGQLGPRVWWARAMPSPAVRSGRGLTAIALPSRFPNRLRTQVHALFANVGHILTIPENKFDAFTVTYSCSHGYHALATLATAAEKLGLDRKTALAAATHALADGILTWREGKIKLEDLLEEAATPGGIAASTMSAQDDAGYALAVERGLRAGLARTKENARRFSTRLESEGPPDQPKKAHQSIQGK
jgi:pyrroline-5-carboxylate reductase